MDSSHGVFFSCRQAMTLDAIHSIMEQAGFSVTEARMIDKGFANEVYDVTIKGGEHVILRARGGGAAFVQEAWAIERCREVGVPVAEILYLKAATLHNGENDIMIQAKVPGSPLAQIQHALDSETRDRVLFEAGEILRTIHSIRVVGCGSRLGKESWEFGSWAEYRDSFMSDREKQKAQIVSAGMPENQFQAAVTEIDRFFKEYVPEWPVLCHGDFMPPHIFVAGDRVSGIIDFGYFRGNSPFLDLAWFNLCTSDEDLTSLAAGYQARGKVSNFEDGLRLQKMALVLLQIGQMVSDKQKRADDVLSARLQLLRHLVSKSPRQL